jgi:tRNA (guanine-N1)-methyltransferase
MAKYNSRAIVAGAAAMFEMTATVRYERRYPATVNAATETKHALAAAEVVRHEVQDGDSRLRGTIVPAVARELAAKPAIAFVCGRYEGFDARIATSLAAEELSIGDYVLSGGEVAAMVVVDAVARLLPGVLGHEESAGQDSFSGAERLVEGPQYTRPREFRGLAVPEILLSGDHGRIATWRREQAVSATANRSRSQPAHSPSHP